MFNWGVCMLGMEYIAMISCGVQMLEMEYSNNQLGCTDVRNGIQPCLIWKYACQECNIAMISCGVQMLEMEYSNTQLECTFVRR